MTVIEADGVETEPVDVQSLVVRSHCLEEKGVFDIILYRSTLASGIQSLWRLIKMLGTIVSAARFIRRRAHN